MAYLLPSTLEQGSRRMNSKLRAVLAVVAGIIVAMVLIAIIESIGLSLHPAPPGADPSDPEAMRAYVAGLPARALLLVLAAWLIGAYVGGVVAASIARRPDPRPFTFAVAFVVLAGALYNLLTIPHPVWMLPAAALGIPLAAVLATFVVVRGFAKAANRAERP